MYWKKNDPIIILQNFLIKKQWIKNDLIKDMKNVISNQIDLAFQYAERSPFPKKKDLFKYIYK